MPPWQATCWIIVGCPAKNRKTTKSKTSIFLQESKLKLAITGSNSFFMSDVIRFTTQTTWISPSNGVSIPAGNHGANFACPQVQIARRIQPQRRSQR
jgi:hypothetical protein